MGINKDEVGLTLRFDTDFDLSSNTDVALIIEDPNGVTVTATGTIATATYSAILDNIENSGQSEDVESNEYIEVTSASDIFTVGGIHRIRAKYIDGSKTLYSDFISVEVGE